MILARSPYYIISDDITGNTDVTAFKIELRIWRGDKVTDKPVDPTVEFNIIKPSESVNRLFKDVSPHIRDFFLNENINAFTDGIITYDSVVWVEWLGVHEGDVLIPNVEGIEHATDGYTNYISGINQTSFSYITDMVRSNTIATKKVLDTGITIIPLQRGSIYRINDADGLSSTIDLTLANDASNEQVVYSVFDNNNFNTFIAIEKVGTGFIGRWEKVCEAKFDPQNIVFKNKYGVYENIYFFKKPVKSINLESSEYAQNLRNGITFSEQTTTGLTFQTNKHQFKTFTNQAKKTLSAMTGFVDDRLNENIEQLLLSENVFIQEGNQLFPINIKTKSLEFQTQLVNQKVNYEIEFEFAYNQINTL